VVDALRRILTALARLSFLRAAGTVTLQLRQIHLSSVVRITGSTLDPSRM